MRKKIQIPIYSCTLTIILAEDWNAINKKHRYDLSENDSACFYAHDHNYTVAFIGLPSVRTIAHESMHLVNQLFIDKHIKVDLDNDEPQAYLMGWTVEQIHKFFYPKTKPNEKTN